MGDTDKIYYGQHMGEKRAHKRVIVSCDVRVGLAESGEALFVGDVLNISQGGVLVEIEAHKSPDHTRILAKKLSLDIDCKNPIHCAGFIVWSAEWSSDNGPRKRFGIKIREMDETNESRLIELIERSS